MCAVGISMGLISTGSVDELFHVALRTVVLEGDTM